MKRFFVFDVDDVFVDMDQLAARAVDAVGSALVTALGEARGLDTHRRFAANYDVLRNELRAPPDQRADVFVQLRKDIERWQRGVLSAGHELKIWSRETMLAVALERAGAAITGDLVHGVVDTYWVTLRDHSRVFDDTARAVARIRVRNDRFHLATNSDGNLRYDATAETFVYDPTYAQDSKWSRLRVLESVGVDRRTVTIGDPIGKPNPKFFVQALADFTARVGSIDLARSVAVGDSYQDDLRPLLELGVPHGVWLLRRDTGPTPRVFSTDPRVTIVQTLDDLEAAC